MRNEEEAITLIWVAIVGFGFGFGFAVLLLVTR